MKIRQIPATMVTAPKTALAVIFSLKSMKPAMAAKSGDVDEIGTARVSDVIVKL